MAIFCLEVLMLQLVIQLVVTTQILPGRSMWIKELLLCGGVPILKTNGMMELTSTRLRYQVYPKTFRVGFSGRRFLNQAHVKISLSTNDYIIFYLEYQYNVLLQTLIK